MPRNRNSNRIDEAALHRLKGIFIGPAIKEPSVSGKHKARNNNDSRRGRGSVPENTCVFPKKLISRESDRTRGISVAGGGNEIVFAFNYRLPH
ncbi:hypothetical protein CEXT_732691 [Caerostris extrusa]|uniref:Uncharacterized protein n=1 Tax=Caerostris extrusa TaxID=172846 RepID=A0AAV4QY46_CAEEX|nr:hypothetical protein CEXT_732691 [Caerostris extrusa]